MFQSSAIGGMVVWSRILIGADMLHSRTAPFRYHGASGSSNAPKGLFDAHRQAGDDELDLVGKKLRVNGTTLEIFKRTERCAATNVDPETGARDQKIPSFLSKTLGHTDFGVYARVLDGGRLTVGDSFQVTD